MTTPIYLTTDATRGYGRNRGFTLADIGVVRTSEDAFVELQFFGRRGAINASVNLTRDDTSRLVRTLNTLLIEQDFREAKP